MESWLFLALILFVGFITKNQSIVIATIFVMILKFLPHTSHRGRRLQYVAHA